MRKKQSLVLDSSITSGSWEKWLCRQPSWDKTQIPASSSAPCLTPSTSPPFLARKKESVCCLWGLQPARLPCTVGPHSPQLEWWTLQLWQAGMCPRFASATGYRKQECWKPGSAPCRFLLPCPGSSSPASPDGQKLANPLPAPASSYSTLS